jgi:hypothetical protein
MMARFWAKVARTAPDQCWLWTAGKTKQGYGVFLTKTTKPVVLITAHRFSLQVATGHAGEGMMACHRCDTPACVNPTHLFWGTQADNMLDARLKGRTRGAPRQTHCKHGHKYTAETVLETSKGRQCKICNRERALRLYHQDVERSRTAQNERNRRRKMEQRI